MFNSYKNFCSLFLHSYLPMAVVVVKCLRAMVWNMQIQSIKVKVMHNIQKISNFVMFVKSDHYLFTSMCLESPEYFFCR